MLQLFVWDHEVPVSCGGADYRSNRWNLNVPNGVKALWTPEEMGWQLHPPGKLEE